MYRGEYLHDCVYDSTQVVSVFLGLFSIGIWMIATLPQIWTNYRSKRVDALSFTFLLQWLGGDISNLIGCIWTHQLPTQVYQGVYFVATDFLLVSQWLYYAYIYPRLSGKSCRGNKINKINKINENRSHQSKLLAALFVGAMMTMVARSGSILGSLSSTEQFDPVGNPAGRVLLSDGGDVCNTPANTTHMEDIVGCIMAWLSATLYFFSRMPQILKNFRRKSLRGINIVMFALAILANSTYGISIIMRVPDIDSRFYKSTLPYIVGSVGTLVFDGTICVQFLFYGDGVAAGAESKGDDHSIDRAHQYHSVPDIDANINISTGLHAFP